MNDMENCLNTNIQLLIKAGYYKSKEDIPIEDIEKLKRCIKNAKGEKKDIMQY